jgi:hypothetical protein
MTNTFSLSKYNVTDSFDLYQREIRAFPSLTAEEEFELGTKLKLNNDLEAAKKLILSHLKLVIKIARSYSGYGLPVSDLVQEGNVGLMKAVKKFNVHYGDSTEQVIRWKSGTDVSTLAGKPIRIRFILKDADLYSYQFGTTNVR